jgi:hypothetical protein
MLSYTDLRSTVWVSLKKTVLWPVTWGWDNTGKYLQDGQVLDWIICVSQDITRRQVRSKLTNRPLNATCPLAYVVLRPWNWWLTRSVRTNLTPPRTATSIEHTVSQETPRILWDTKVHCRFHKSLPLDIILSRISPQTTSSYSVFTHCRYYLAIYSHVSNVVSIRSRFPSRWLKPRTVSTTFCNECPAANIQKFSSYIAVNGNNNGKLSESCETVNKMQTFLVLKQVIAVPLCCER